jgi:hypothetical protein
VHILLFKNVIFFFFFCSYTKLENRREEQVLTEGLVLVGGDRRWGKEVGG